MHLSFRYCAFVLVCVDSSAATTQLLPTTAAFGFDDSSSTGKKGPSFGAGDLDCQLLRGLPSFHPWGKPSQCRVCVCFCFPRPKIIAAAPFFSCPSLPSSLLPVAFPRRRLQNRSRTLSHPSVTLLHNFVAAYSPTIRQASFSKLLVPPSPPPPQASTTSSALYHPWAAVAIAVIAATVTI